MRRPFGAGQRPGGPYHAARLAEGRHAPPPVLAYVALALPLAAVAYVLRPVRAGTS